MFRDSLVEGVVRLQDSKLCAYGHYNYTIKQYTYYLHDVRLV
jgi:hypothetical protein